MKSPLAVRITSAVVLLALLSAAFWFSLFAVVFTACIICLWEYEGLSKKWSWPTAWYVLYPLGFLLLNKDYLSQRYLVAGGSAIVALGLLFLLAAYGKRGLGRWGVSVGGALYLGFCLSFAFTATNIKGPLDHYGTDLLIAVLAAVFAGDSVAFLFGSRFGRHRLAPKISPKKSVEGAIAHVAVSCAVTLAFTWYWGFALWPWWLGFLAGIAISVVAQAGDLFESKLKRLAGVKDSSNLIPGHGGMLDRIDSLIFVMPLTAAIGALASSLSR